MRSLFRETTMLNIQMDSNPVLDPNQILDEKDLDAVSNHILDCGLFSNNCNTESTYNAGGASRA